MERTSGPRERIREFNVTTPVAAWLTAALRACAKRFQRHPRRKLWLCPRQCHIRAARAAIGARTRTSSPRRSPVSIPTGATGSPPATVCAPVPSQHAGPPPSEGRIAGRWLPASPRPPMPRGRFVPGREKPVERSTGTRGGAHSPNFPIHLSSDARDAVPPGPSNHVGVPPRRPRATVRRAGRRRDSVESGAGSRARPGAASRCRRIRRRAPPRRPFPAFAASAAPLRDPAREGSRGSRTAFIEILSEPVSTHDSDREPVERR